MKKILSMGDFLNEDTQDVQSTKSSDERMPEQETKQGQETSQNNDDSEFEKVFNYAFKPLIEDSIPINIPQNTRGEDFQLIRISNGYTIYFKLAGGLVGPKLNMNKDNIKDAYEDHITYKGNNRTYHKAVGNFLKEKAKEMGIKKNSETTEKSLDTEPVENPFRQAICVIGESNAGKSYTVADILDNTKPEHDYRFIIPTSTSTGLLSQFSPSKHGYGLSILGDLIIKSIKNPKTFFTAVFDECHKPNVIEMINDELLQCISTRRNGKNRFITLDSSTLELYKEQISGISYKTYHGDHNIIIPNNFGFIFISSKEEVLANNPDFINRVDLIELSEEDKGKIKDINQLLSKKVDDSKLEAIKTKKY